MKITNKHNQDYKTLNKGLLLTLQTFNFKNLQLNNKYENYEQT